MTISTGPGTAPSGYDPPHAHEAHVHFHPDPAVRDAYTALVATTRRALGEASPGASHQLVDVLAERILTHANAWADLALRSGADPAPLPPAPDPEGYAELVREVQEAIGTASTCWKPKPTGTFDSEQALVVADRILAAVRAYAGEPSPDPGAPADDSEAVQ